MTDHCVFCEGVIPDLAEGFIVHVKNHQECHSRWLAWKEYLSEDWGGD